MQSLSNKYIIDIACGGFHSAAISRYGHLYTWGKGRYGRLGHGDYEDYVYPKLVSYFINTTFFNLFKYLFIYFSGSKFNKLSCCESSMW